MLNESNNIVISTGNILSVTKKAGQKTTEEVSHTQFHKINYFFSSKSIMKQLNYKYNKQRKKIV